MSSKRKLGALGLERRVKARREEDWEPDLGASDDDDDSGEEVSSEGEVDSSDEDQDSEAESGSEVCKIPTRQQFFRWVYVC